MFILRDLTYENMHLIKFLWESNRQYHETRSMYFAEDYAHLNFEDRMAFLEHLNSDQYKLTIAEENSLPLGYCLSICHGERGELISLHVLECCRGKGVGKTLSEQHLKWLKDNGCESIEVTVSQENSDTIAFYSKMGFLPNTLQMKLK